MFAGLPEAELRRLSGTVVPVRLPAGHLVYDPEVTVVVAGTVRAFVADATGRQLTVSYLRPPDTLGLTRLAGRRYPTAFQSLADTWVLSVGDDTFTRLRAGHAGLGWAAAREIGARLDEVEAELARVAFADLRHRVAYHLLAMSGDGASPAPVPHAQLAFAVGSVREVIGRNLAQLRAEGLVEVGPAGAVVTDVEGLRRATEAR